MNKRTKGKSKMNLAIEDLKNLELDLESDFIIFFKDLIEFTNQKIREIKNKVWGNLFYYLDFQYY